MTIEDAKKCLEAHYEYETENNDAADSYSVVFEEVLSNIRQSDLEDETTYLGGIAICSNDAVTIREATQWGECRFFIYGPWVDSPEDAKEHGLIAHIYLGQNETECQLPKPLTKKQIEKLSSDYTFDWVVNESNPDLAYRTYPDNLCVGLFYNQGAL